jgi:hypothetical protein
VERPRLLFVNVAVQQAGLQRRGLATTHPVNQPNPCMDYLLLERLSAAIRASMALLQDRAPLACQRRITETARIRDSNPVESPTVRA